MESKQGGFATRAIHAGQPPDSVTGAVCVPISLATTFIQKSPGVHSGFEYSRTGNPTRNAFEACIASIENAKHGLAFASGSSALVTIMHLFNSGDHIICVDDVYGGTQRFMNKVSKTASNLVYDFVDCTQPGALQAALRPGKTRLVWIETPTNPTLKLIDIKETCELAHRAGAIVCVDNTFMSPFFQQPINLGADLVLHSVTKYLNGHSDVVMGIVVTNNDELHTRLRFLQNAIGAIPAPFDCYMAMRGVKTLHVRMREHATNAMAVAKLLERHPAVERVLYPGLPSHPQHELAKRQMSGFGGMITFFIKGGLSESRTFLESLKLFVCAESLGAVECLAEHPAIMTHASVPPEQRKKLGISDTLIRLSIGIEDQNDILADIQHALDAVRNGPRARM